MTDSNDSRTDQAALFGAALAAALGSAVAEGNWDGIDFVLGLVPLFVLLAYYRPVRPARFWDGLWKCLAFAAVVGFALALVATSGAQFLHDRGKQWPLPSLGLWWRTTDDLLRDDWAFVLTWLRTALLGAVVWLILLWAMPRPSSDQRGWKVEYSNGEHAHLTMSDTTQDGGPGGRRSRPAPPEAAP